jgi:hypothetical protein
MPHKNSNISSPTSTIPPLGISKFPLNRPSYFWNMVWILKEKLSSPSPKDTPEGPDSKEVETDPTEVEVKGEITTVIMKMVDMIQTEGAEEAEAEVEEAEAEETMAKADNPELKANKVNKTIVGNIAMTEADKEVGKEEVEEDTEMTDKDKTEEKEDNEEFIKTSKPVDSLKIKNKPKSSKSKKNKVPLKYISGKYSKK